MNPTEEQIEGMKYFGEKYDLIFMHALVAEEENRFWDGASEAEPRVCRFCGKTSPEVSFNKKAHAIPEFLVNKSIISMNECDTCNEYIANNAENDLANALGLSRTAMKMEGKKGIPTFVGKDYRMEESGGGLAFSTTAPIADPGLKEGESVDFTLPVETWTQAFTPINAAKALVKMGCSISPVEELAQLQPAINWVMGRAKAEIKRFPIIFSFTPGMNPFRVGMAIVLRRKVDEKIPYLWCVIASANVCFQFPVPFCPKDKMEMESLSARAFPLPFTEFPHGPTKWHVLNWASDVKAPQKQEITFHADKVTKTVPATPAPPAGPPTA